MKNYFERGFAIDGGEATVYKEGIAFAGQFDTQTSCFDAKKWSGERLGHDGTPYRPGDGGFKDHGNALIVGPWWNRTQQIPLAWGWTPGWPETLPDGRHSADLTDEEREEFVRNL